MKLIEQFNNQAQNSPLEYIEMFCEMAKSVGAFHNKTEKELKKQIFKETGFNQFITISNCVFAVNEFGIIQGIGLMVPQGLKVWNNKCFGTFNLNKYDPVQLAIESEEKRIKNLSDKEKGIFFNGWV